MSDVYSRDSLSPVKSKPFQGSSAGDLFVADGFKITQYHPDLVMNNTAIAAPLPEGVEFGGGRVFIFNRGLTGQFSRLAFGATQEEANSRLNIVAGGATTGFPIPPLIDYQLPPLGVPLDAKFAAICNETAGNAHVISWNAGV